MHKRISSESRLGLKAGLTDEVQHKHRRSSLDIIDYV